MLASVLIPCWNALDFTKVCLAQLARWTTAPYELVAVDNGSSDGTWDWLKSWRRGHEGRGALRRVALLRSAVNRGYSGGMNRALAAARGEVVVFGNADAAVSPGWLEEMRAVFSSRARLGGLSPCVNPMEGRSPRRPWAAPWYDDLKGMERLAAACALKPQGESFIPSTGFIPGFWFMTSRRVLAKVGAFDERFFPGSFEDCDLQYRMMQAGFETGWAGRAYVHHAWSAVSRRNGLRQERLYPPCKRLFYAKHPRAHGLYLEVRTPLPAAARAAT